MKKLVKLILLCLIAYPIISIVSSCFRRRRLLHECTSDDGMLSIYGGQGK